jgi:hypothetical protein
MDARSLLIGFLCGGKSKHKAIAYAAIKRADYFPN